MLYGEVWDHRAELRVSDPKRCRGLPVQHDLISLYSIARCGVGACCQIAFESYVGPMGCSSSFTDTTCPRYGPGIRGVPL